MTPEQVARDIFQRHQDAVVAAAETQTDALVGAAQRVVRCLLEEGRIFACGTGCSAANAQHLTVRLLNRLERDRPGLPVFCLSDSAPLLTALAAEAGGGDIFARPLRALGRAGDLLIVFSSAGTAPGLVQTVLGAHERDMNVIAFTGHEGGDVGRVLLANDIEVRIPVHSPVRTDEVHLLLLNVLCELTERELFGDAC
ncbi:MAG: SIS domain-containing protein [Gammaproteobacteria bacterium]